ncbi:hypothetical protein Trydic_g11378 [Trypoxylus dichotomus]
MLYHRYYALVLPIYAIVVPCINTFEKNITNKNILLRLLQVERRVLTAGGLFDPVKEMRFILYSREHKNGIKLDIHKELRPVCLDLTEAYLNRGNYNVILVDWDRMATIYTNTLVQINDIAQVIATFVEKLIREGADPKQVHLIGHSLGAHIMGVAGRFMHKLQIGRATGLDPAGPMLQLVGDDKLIGRDSAEFVDIIHTSSGIYGYDSSVGTVDFYPNGGVTQPGCAIVIVPQPSCDHARSWKYFAESIQHPTKFPSIRCSSYTKFRLGLCHSETVYMGEDVAKNAIGKINKKSGSGCDIMIIFKTVLSTLLILWILPANIGQIIDDTVNNLLDTIYDVSDLVLPFANRIDPFVKRYVYNRIYFFLYNEYYPNGIGFQLRNYENINISVNKTTKVLIHGWENNRNSAMPRTLRREYEKLQKYNILVVDWSALSRIILYPLPANGTTIVGECTANVLRGLYRNLSTRNLNVHLLGFSLGAHIGGFAGRILLQQGFTVDRITGLDPARPLIENGLSSTDAKFVDIIHTSSGVVGEVEPTGHVDFYPNGGRAPQPGCLATIVRTLLCSHYRSWQYYAQTITNPTKYLAYRCDSYIDFISGTCYGFAYMGESVPKSARGVFYLSTVGDIF